NIFLCVSAYKWCMVWRRLYILGRKLSYPTRVRGTLMGFLTGWFNFSTFAGSLIYTLLVIFFSTDPILIWIIMAIGLSAGQLFALTLRKIKSGEVLEDISY
ncbi:hypothetical protein SE19_01290, partial [Acidiplasma aeolicum]